MANAVVLRQLLKRYGSFTAVHPFDLTIEEGEFLTLLGPSGCGKTTTLRMIAGLEDVTGGDITIGGRLINDVPIHKRNLGIVFQNYALFPHKTVFDNVAFGLKYRNLKPQDIKIKVDKALERVRLPQMANRFPSQLSGGQQQRVALARAIVIEPDVLLLDEPLSALDANLRENMRVELKRIQKELGVTSIFVTHDQSEALAMSDKVVIMSDGHVEQVGTPEEVYNEPNCEFVASFLGVSNVLDGIITEVNDAYYCVDLSNDDGHLLSITIDKKNKHAFQLQEKVRIVLRAEHLHLSAVDDQLNSKQAEDNLTTVFTATVDAVDYQGQLARYFIKRDNQILEAVSPINRKPFREGDKINVSIRSHETIMLSKIDD